jgi:uncharacterized protein (DUF983 family)
MSAHQHPSLISSVVTNKCPRCRKGHLFTYNNPYNLKKSLKMPDNCANCGQSFEPEVGFYYGTGYVSYGLSIAISVALFIAWWIIFGFSLNDNSLFHYLAADIALLLLLQPLLMRLSRSIWIAFFVRYDKKANRITSNAVLQP